MTRYEVDISLSQETAMQLTESSLYLYGLMATQSSVGGGMPTVWMQYNQFEGVTQVGWQDQAMAYTSSSPVVPNGAIDAGIQAGSEPGQTMTIVPGGGVQRSASGTPGAITFVNSSPGKSTVGLAASWDNGTGILCAVPLSPKVTAVVRPIERVLFMFSTILISSSIAVENAFAPGLLIDMTAATQRSVTFDINSGWSWDGGSWATPVNANDNLVSLLMHS